MIFTTNKHPKRWGDVLHDDDLADAIVDRILERGRLLRLDGPSLRTKHLPEAELRIDDHEHTGGRRVSGVEAAEFPQRTTLEETPRGETHWSTRTMAKHIGLSRSTISRVWRALGLQPHGGETIKLSKDPLLVPKVRDIVGLYLPSSPQPYAADPSAAP